jgi:hypothetical protein
MIFRTLLLSAAAAALAACASNSSPPPVNAPARAGPPPADVRRACEAEAYRRFQQIPAVSSGKTSYDSGGVRQQFYAECLARKSYR